VLLQRDPTGGFKRPFLRKLAASYSLRIGLFLTASPYTQLAYQTNFPAQDEFTRAATLALDDAALTGLFTGAVTSVAATLEVEITESGGEDRTLYREDLTVRKPLIPSANVSVQPGEVAATQAWVKSIAFPRDGGNVENPADHFFIKTRPSGFIVMVTLNDDATPNFTLQ
jgi:hypothetical protein